ncbi:MAG: ABC transporter substrate-binding protein [Acidimicrobiales bacterium]
MGSTIDRRTFLRRGSRAIGAAASVGIVTPALLEACSSSKPPSRAVTPTTLATSVGPTVAPGIYGALTVGLPWVKDVQSAGEFIADASGYFAQQGFSSVTLVPGWPSKTSPEAQVQAGKVLIAVSSLDAAAAAIANGHPIVVIGCEFQKSPFCIMSLESKPIANPGALIGKRIGVQSTNAAVWSAFLTANNMDQSKLDTVPVQFDPTPLAQGQLDGWFSSSINEPIELGVQGIKTTTFLLNDFNYPEVANVFITSSDALKTSRAKVKAAMTAEILGWRESIRSPDTGADLSVSRYGSGLTLTVERQQARAQNLLMATGDALTSGLFSISPAAQLANVKTVGLGGIAVTAAQLFDMSVLDEIYQARPDLKVVPTPGA